MTNTGKWAAAAAIVAGISATIGWGGGTSAAPTTTPANGAVLFVAKGCAMCHTGPDSVATFSGFPPLDDAPAWAGKRRPDTTAAGYLTESIVAPQAFISPRFESGTRPMSSMPRLRISPAEVTAIVDYLLANPAPG